MVAVYVARAATPTQDDTDLINMLTNRGHSVTSADAVNSLPNSGHDVCIVTESGSSSSNANTSFPTCSLPCMGMESVWNTYRFSSTAATSVSSVTQWDLTAHSLNSGYPDPFNAYSTARSQFGVTDTTLAAGVEILAGVQGQNTHVCCAVAESGATLTSGTAPARRCVIGFTGTVRITDFIDNTTGADYVEDLVLWLANAGGAPAAVPRPARRVLAALKRRVL